MNIYTIIAEGHHSKLPSQTNVTLVKTSHTCIVFGMPVVASVNLLAGTKALLHAQQMLQILSVYVRKAFG